MWKKLLLLIFLLMISGCGLTGKSTVTVNDKGTKIEVDRSKITYGQWLEISEKEKVKYVDQYRKHHPMKVDDKASEIVEFLKSIPKDCDECFNMVMPEVLSNLEKAYELRSK